MKGFHSIYSSSDINKQFDTPPPPSSKKKATKQAHCNPLHVAIHVFISKCKKNQMKEHH